MKSTPIKVTIILNLNIQIIMKFSEKKWNVIYRISNLWQVIHQDLLLIPYPVFFSIFFSHNFTYVFRRRRSVPDPEMEPHTIRGGERATLYSVVKNYPEVKRRQVSSVSVCRRLPLHIWYGWEGVSDEGNLWGPWVTSPWIWICRRVTRNVSNVSWKNSGIITLKLIILIFSFKLTLKKIYLYSIF